MFRDRPALAADLLTGPLGITVPAFEQARLSAGELTDVAPTEYRADAVVTLNAAGKPVLGVVVEVQLSRDDRKRFVWPVYVSTLRARLRCPVMLLILCPHSGVATWCAEPIEIGPIGPVYTPLVLGPAQMPVVTDPVMARLHPELAVLSTLAHSGRADPTALFEALLAALASIDHESANLYIDLVIAELPAAARTQLEEFMAIAPHEYRSEFMRRLVSESQAEGEAKGEAKGEANALLAVLDARSIPVPDEARETILACTDRDLLDTWIRRAATATTVEDVLT